MSKTTRYSSYGLCSSALRYAEFHRGAGTAPCSCCREKYRRINADDVAAREADAATWSYIEHRQVAPGVVQPVWGGPDEMGVATRRGWYLSLASQCSAEEWDATRRQIIDHLRPMEAQGRIEMRVTSFGVRYRPR